MAAEWQSLFRPLSEPLATGRRKKGGWRMQQLRSPLAVVRRCRTVELHLRDWAEGFTSPVRVWRHMRALQADGFTAPAIKRLGGISNREGGKGHHANLLRLLEPCGFSEFIDDVDGNGAVSKCIFPTTIFKCCLSGAPNTFVGRLVQNRKGWSGFGSGCSRHRRACS